MNWEVLGTALASAMAVATPIALYIIKRFRDSDLDMIKGLKADSDTKIKHLDTKIDALDNRVADVYTNVQAKLDKQDHQIALARIDKELDAVRRDQKEDFSKIDMKLDRLMELVHNAKS